MLLELWGSSSSSSSSSFLSLVAVSGDSVRVTDKWLNSCFHFVLFSPGLGEVFLPVGTV